MHAVRSRPGPRIADLLRVRQRDRTRRGVSRLLRPARVLRQQLRQDGTAGGREHGVVGIADARAGTPARGAHAILGAGRDETAVADGPARRCRPLQCGSSPGERGHRERATGLRGSGNARLTGRHTDSMSEGRVDTVIVGGGHNGLVAAAYLAKAGRSVRVLERLGHVGGAAVSLYPFDGIDARLSRYSYLVSLLPRRIVDDLGARIRLARRRYSSYTPDPSDGGRSGLLIGPESTFGAVGAAADEAGFGEFYRQCATVTSALWPTLTEPLRTRSEAHRAVVGAGGRDAWQWMIERPLAEAITSAVGDDLVRGVMATDALIGTFARLDEESLVQNRCF